MHTHLNVMVYFVTLYLQIARNKKKVISGNKELHGDFHFFV